MWHGVSVVVRPTGELISLEKLKQRLRIDVPDDDVLLPDLLRGAIARVDGPTGIGYAMLRQTWRKSLDCFSNCIVLPGAPIKNVTSIKYLDADGVERTLPSTDYHFDLDAEPLRILPAFGKSWPSTRNVVGAVKIDYELGEDDAEAVAPDLIDVICLLVADRYQNREATIAGAISDLPLGVDYILREYRRGHVAA